MNPRDPIEPYNRVMYSVNDAIDRNVLKPVSEGYKFVVPRTLRIGVRNFFANLEDVWIGTNNLFQLKVGDAAADQLVLLGVPVEARELGAGPVVGSVKGLDAREGEIVGLAAVEGNGQRELLRALLGPSVAFVPEDRTTEGLIGGFSLTENLVLGLSRDPRWATGAWIDWPAARSRMAELLGQFGIRASGADAPARSLSGGNQQKVVLARAFEAKPRLLVAENPTRGLDIHATAFVHEQLRGYARGGGSVVFYSTDLDEVLSLANRVVVMVRGAVVLVPAGASRRRVGAMMLGVSE